MARRLLVAASASALLTACAQATTESPASPAAPTAEADTQTPPPSPSQGIDGKAMREAIEAYLASKGLQYAGDCANTDLAEDVGKYCSHVVDDRGVEVVARIGPTFSEFEYYLLIRADQGWKVVRTEEIPRSWDDDTLPF